MVLSGEENSGPLDRGWNMDADPGFLVHRSRETDKWISNPNYPRSKTCSQERSCGLRYEQRTPTLLVLCVNELKSSTPHLDSGILQRMGW